MPAPQIISSYSSSYTTTGTSKSVLIDCQANDMLVVYAIGEKNVSFPSLPSASGITFATVSSYPGDATNGAVSVYYAPRMSSQSSLNVSLSEPTGTKYWGFTCLVVRNSHNIVYRSNSGWTTAPFSTGRARMTRSLWLQVMSDGNGVDGSSRVWRTAYNMTPTSGNGYELTYQNVSGLLTAYAGYYPMNSVLTTSKGLTQPSAGLGLKLVDHEILGDDGVFPLSAFPASSSSAAVTTRTFNLNMAANPNRLLVASAFVGVQPGNGTDTGVTTSITYDGVPMISAAKIHSNSGAQGYVEVFYLVSPTPGASKTVTLTASTSVDLGLTAQMYYNVSQASPISDITTSSGSSASPSLTFGSNLSRETYYAAVVSANAVSSPSISGGGVGVDQSTRTINTLSDGGCSGALSIVYSTSGTSPTMTWTTTSGPWAMIGFKINPTSDLPAYAVAGFRA